MTEKLFNRPMTTERQRYQALFDFLPDGYLETDPAGIIQEANYAAATLFRVNQDFLIGQSLLDFVADGPAERQGFRNQLTQLTHLERVQNWEVRLQPREGMPFSASLTVGVGRDADGRLVGLRWLLHDITERKQVDEAGQPYYDLGMLNDITERKQTELTQAFANQAAIAIENARLHTKSERWAEQLTILNKAGRTMASSLDLGQVLDQVMIEITTLVKAEGASLLLLEPESNELVFVASISPASEQLIGTRMPATVGIAGWAVQERQSILVDNAQHDPRFYQGIDTITNLTTRSLLAVPLMFREKVIGVIEVINKLAGVFDPSDLDLLEALASSAAIAIENARLFETTRQSEERYRHLFNNSPISIWEQDFSAVKIYLDQLREAGIKDLGAYLKQQPQEVRRCAKLVKLVEVNQASLALYQASTKEEFLTGLDPFLSQETYETFREELAVMAAGQTAYEYETTNQTLLGDKVNIWLRSSIAPGYEATWSKVLVSIIDITALKQAQAALQHAYQEMETRVADRTRELSVLYEVTALANASPDLAVTLGKSLELVLKTLNSSAGTIYLLDETNDTTAGEMLRLVTWRGRRPNLRSYEKLAWQVVRQNEPLIVPNVAARRHRAATHSNRRRACAGIPLRAGEHMLGVLSIFRQAEQPPFNVEEISLLTSVADQLGIVVERTRLRQRVEQAVVREERERLARNLHDSVTQLLYSINLFAKSGRNAYRLGEMDQLDNCLSELGAIGQQALREMRLLVYELRPPVLEQQGLVGAIRHRLDTVEGRVGVKTQLLTGETIQLPEGTEEELYHIAIEALNNALKHGQAAGVIVRLNADEQQIQLEIVDNGVGFSPEIVEGKGGLGIISMHQRANKLGGTLTIQSAPGEGTWVQVLIREVC